MEKTITLNIEELKQRLVRDIQESNLPVTVIDLIVKDIYNDIHTLSREYTAKEIQEYQSSISI